MGDVPCDESLDPPPARRSLWTRLVERTLRVLTEPGGRARSQARPPTEPKIEDDDWDWKIAHARARAATHPGM